MLSGGNPQIAGADGPAPVKAYIAAMPGCKKDVGRRRERQHVDQAETLRRDPRDRHASAGVDGRGAGPLGPGDPVGPALGLRPPAGRVRSASGSRQATGGPPAVDGTSSSTRRRTRE